MAQAFTRIWPEAEVFVISAMPFSGWASFAGKWEPLPPTPLPEGEGRVRVFRFTPFNLFTIFNIVKYPPLLRIMWHIIDMFNLHTYLVARKILLREKPDLIITRNLKGLGYTIPLAIRYTLPAYRTGRHATRYTTKWIHTLHDESLLHPRGFMEWGKEGALRNPNPLVRIYRAAARHLFGSPNAIVAPSRFILNEYNAAQFFPRSKKFVVPNPVMDIANNSSISPSPQPSPTRGEGVNRVPSPFMGEGQGEGVRFLYVGQLEPYKGIKLLLSAWQEFVREYSSATLEIVGQGSMRDEVDRVSRMFPSVHYRGFVPHDELTQVFMGATAVIFPTLAYESFGLVAIESFAAGVPVISSRIGALPEIIEDGRQGILITPGDKTELLRAMRILIKDGAALRRSAISRSADFSLASFQKRMYSVYKGLT